MEVWGGKMTYLNRGRQIAEEQVTLTLEDNRLGVDA